MKDTSNNPRQLYS